MCVTKKLADHITQGRPTNPTGLFTFETARRETPDKISCFGFDDGCISEGERDKKGRMTSGDIKKMLHYWEEFQSLATKWHPNKAEMNRLVLWLKTSV